MFILSAANIWEKMTTVFIGGSRAIGRLNEPIRARLKNVVDGELRVLVGDANGADRAVQRFLAEEGYRDVTVYCAGTRCRNNIGNWQTQHVTSGSRSRGFQFYTAKDIAMSKEADYGFMLWDGKSVGTLHNVLNLIQGGKQVVVYFSPERDFVTVRTPEDIQSLVNRCPAEAIQKFEKRLELDRRIRSPQSELNLATG